MNIIIQAQKNSSIYYKQPVKNRFWKFVNKITRTRSFVRVTACFKLVRLKSWSINQPGCLQFVFDSGFATSQAVASVLEGRKWGKNTAHFLSGLQKRNFSSSFQLFPGKERSTGTSGRETLFPMTTSFKK